MALALGDEITTKISWPSTRFRIIRCGLARCARESYVLAQSEEKLLLLYAVDILIGTNGTNP